MNSVVLQIRTGIFSRLAQLQLRAEHQDLIIQTTWVLFTDLCVYQGDADPVIVKEHATFGTVEIQLLSRERKKILSVTCMQCR